MAEGFEPKPDEVLALAVAIALLVGFGWWVWEYLVADPLPYRDPEAIESSATAIASRVL
jgi:hypothetical protein